jgi:hypothetical protein
VNLRLDHYKIRVPGPKSQASLIPVNCLLSLVARSGGRSQQPELVVPLASILFIKLMTTFDNGSLGSRNDEERSELR